MKKFLSLWLVASVIVMFALPANIANATLLEETMLTNVRAHYNSYVSDDGLCSDNIVSSQEEFEITLTETTFKVNGILDNKPLNISAAMNNGVITFIEDTFGNYEILSIQDFSDTLRVVMKNPVKFDIYFADIIIPSHSQLNIESYQPNWYAGFIKAEIVEKVPSHTTFATTTNYFREFNNTTSVYGDTINECLIIGFFYEWDRSFTGTGDFKLNCGISENYTEYTPYGAETEIWDGSSLNLHDPYLLLSTATGDYISSISTNVVGAYSISSETFVDYSLSIPNTDFSLSLTLPRSTEAKNGASGYFTFPATDSSKATQANVEWMAEDYYCTNSSGNPNILGDNFEADIDIKYVDSYAVHNTSKKLTTRWDFRIYSDGNCNGYAVDAYITTSSFSNSVYYTTY